MGTENSEMEKVCPRFGIPQALNFRGIYTTMTWDSSASRANCANLGVLRFHMSSWWSMLKLSLMIIPSLVSTFGPQNQEK